MVGVEGLHEAYKAEQESAVETGWVEDEDWQAKGEGGMLTWTAHLTIYPSLHSYSTVNNSWVL